MFVLESNYCHITSYIPTRWTIRSWLPVYVSACLHVYVSTSLPVCHLFQACSFQVCPFSNSLRLGSSRVDKENRLCWAGIRPKRQSFKTPLAPHIINPTLSNLPSAESDKSLRVSSICHLSRTSPVGVIREADCGARPRSLPRTPPLHPSIPQ